MATTLTTDEILVMINQKIGQAVSELGGNVPVYSPEFILGYAKTQNLEMQVMGLTTGIDVTSTSINPDAALTIGLLLAYGTAASIIRDDLLDRLKNGELGVSFTSGASSISTNQAGLFLKQSAKGLEDLYNRIFTKYLSSDPNAIIARDQ